MRPTSQVSLESKYRFANCEKPKDAFDRHNRAARAERKVSCRGPLQLLGMVFGLVLELRSQHRLNGSEFGVAEATLEVHFPEIGEHLASV